VSVLEEPKNPDSRAASLNASLGHRSQNCQAATRLVRPIGRIMANNTHLVPKQRRVERLRSAYSARDLRNDWNRY
jgi:hypothetical protein